MTTSLNAGDLRDREVFDRDDEKVGKVGEVYVDNASGEAKWVTVNTGLFGTKETFVPLEGARETTKGLQVATDKKTIKDAPHAADSSNELSESGEHDLHAHYGLGSGAGGGRDTRSGREHDRSDARAQHRADRDTDRDARGDQGRTGHGDEGMTLSEERLTVGKEQVETGQVRLRKYVVTENQTVNVPVTHEEVRLEREPVRDGRAGGRIGEDEQSVTLHAERATVGKDTYATENVRLAKDTVTEQETYTDDVRKERLDVNDPHGVVDGDRDREGREQHRR